MFLQRPVRSCSKETEDGRRTRRHWTDLRNKTNHWTHWNDTQSPELILWCEEQSNNPDWFDVNQSDITRLPIRQCHMLTVRAAADVCSYPTTVLGNEHKMMLVFPHAGLITAPDMWQVVGRCVHRGLHQRQWWTWTFGSMCWWKNLTCFYYQFWKSFRKDNSYEA